MSQRARRAVAWSVVGVTTAMYAAAVWLSVANRDLHSTLSGAGLLGFAVVGGLILVRRPENRTGLLLCGVGFSMVALGVSTEYATRALITAPGSLPGGRLAAYLVMWWPLVGIGLLVCLLPQVFPEGRALSRRWRPGIWAAWVYIVAGTLANVLDAQVVEGVGNYQNPYPVRALAPYLGPFFALSAICLVVSVLAGLVTLVLRWRRAAGDERQQLKWFVAGVAPLLVPVFLHETFTRFSEAAFGVLLPLVPVAFGVAILRYRLYDLDIVLNRAIVYTVLSGLIALSYLALVAFAQVVVGLDRGLGTQVVATAVAAATFQPARGRIQRAVDTLFYGDRSRPYEALSRLGVLLEHAPVPETVLPGVVESVASALRLPYVAIELREGDGWVTAAAHGEPVRETEKFPMVYQDEAIGQLIVGRRNAGRVGEDFGGADRRLLADLARQAGVAAHAVQLTLALQRSRAALVTAREEERRRLRRDLHDGLGPALAGVILGLHAAARHVPGDPDRAVGQLTALTRQVEEAVRDIRRLVYGLRPPALDELGLAQAIRREAARLEGGAGGLAIAVDVPADGLGALPAAVEAAAYRIVTEALTNVSRHAQASTCAVRLSRGPSLEVEVLDDGLGLDGQPSGVGLTAMRERAAELGGTCRIESLAPGTRVLARLPIMEST
jgi:signal transduction histidine kinase